MAHGTKSVLAGNLTSEMVLVGASGGLSAVYGAQPSSLRRGVMRIVTEHGYLYAEKDDEMEILIEDPSMNLDAEVGIKRHNP